MVPMSDFVVMETFYEPPQRNAGFIRRQAEAGGGLPDESGVPRPGRFMVAMRGSRIVAALN